MDESTRITPQPAPGVPGVLKVTDPPDHGGSLWIEDGERCTVGRTMSNELVLPDAHVSRLHCEIMRSGGQTVLTDHSRTGVFVDGRKIDGDAVLVHGNVLAMGPFRLRYEEESSTAGSGKSTIARSANEGRTEVRR